jgi:hypothetical protein
MLFVDVARPSGAVREAGRRLAQPSSLFALSGCPVVMASGSRCAPRNDAMTDTGPLFALFRATSSPTGATGGRSTLPRAASLPAPPMFSSRPSRWRPHSLRPGPRWARFAPARRSERRDCRFRNGARLRSGDYHGARLHLARLGAATPRRA